MDCCVKNGFNDVFLFVFMTRSTYLWQIRLFRIRPPFVRNAKAGGWNVNQSWSAFFKRLSGHETLNTTNGRQPFLGWIIFLSFVIPRHKKSKLTAYKRKIKKFIVAIQNLWKESVFLFWSCKSARDQLARSSLKWLCHWVIHTSISLIELLLVIQNAF